MMTPGICLVGLGPHSKRIYYRYIRDEVKKGNFRFDTLIDVETKKNDIEFFLKDKDVLPSKILLCKTDGQLAPKKIDISVLKSLETSILNGHIKYAIVATEPKAHKVYIEYFLKKRIPVLTDKPLTAPISAGYKKQRAKNILTDALQLKALSVKHETPLYVQTQRREHPAYVFMFDQIRSVVQEYNIPITFFNIYHSDGTWSMPEEFATRENHPYKYGYGKLLHSGYHFVDLVAQIAEINASIIPTLSIMNRTRVLRPHDHYYQIHGKATYKRFFNRETIEPKKSGLGEIDTYTEFVFRDTRTKRDVTFGHLDLLQSGFSKRAWYDLPSDTYKGNGRVRHEYMNIHVGPLLNIQLHSYQSEEIHRGPKQGIGSEEHLDLCIFRNEKLIGGKAFEVIDYGKLIRDSFLKNEDVYVGQNEVARYTIFQQFLKGVPNRSQIGDQILTNSILSSIFKAMITRKQEQCNI